MAVQVAQTRQTGDEDAADQWRRDTSELRVVSCESGTVHLTMAVTLPPAPTDALIDHSSGGSGPIGHDHIREGGRETCESVPIEMRRSNLTGDGHQIHRRPSGWDLKVTNAA